MSQVTETDYESLARDMAQAGMDNMADVLSEKLRRLPKPKTKNEVRYFWAALFNAAKAHDAVWLWLCTAPHIRHFAPPEAKFRCMPQFVSDIPLPVINGPDDEPLQPSQGPKQYPDAPTEENFREQAVMLDARLRVEGEKNPDNHCKNVREYVESFYFSGTGKILASIQMTEAGFRALATDAGIRYLMETYPPEQ